MIEANWAHNNLQRPSEGTTLHWHGFLQTDRQWMDDVPAFTQYPIPPDHSFTYRFKEKLSGSTWYHAHYSARGRPYNH